MMRIFATATAALAISACVPAVEPEVVATAPNAVALAPMPPEQVEKIVPRNPIPVADQQVLFWDDATRSDRFRDMESYFAGLQAAPAAITRDLPAGDPLPAETQAAISAFMAQSNAAGIMVLQDGKVRHQEYGLDFGPTQRWTSFSVAKSFTATLLGAAVKDGAIKSLDDAVSDYIPGLRGSAYDDVTVEQLATMTSGVAWNEDYTDPNSDVAIMFGIEPVEGESQAVTYMKTLPREAPAGEKWVYKTGETNLLGVLVEKATRRSLTDYAREKIVEPAGFAGKLFWMADLTGGNVGGCCLSLRLSDYARFGQFALEDGRGITPEGWFAAATDSQVDFGSSGNGYGYQWWTYGGGAYGAQGIFGQAITIVPSENLVVAVVSNWPTATDSAGRGAWGNLVGTIAAAK